MKKIKELDRKIFVGILLTIAFLILWLATLPSVDKQNPDKIYEAMNSTEKEARNANDTDLYNTALLLQDNSFCQGILNTSLKKDCLNNAPKKTEDTSSSSEIQETENPEDVNNYNTALLTGDKSYCENIVDEQMKTDCLNG